MAFKPLPLRGFNSYDVKVASEEVGLVCPEPTLAQQHFRDEADINTIVDRFGLTGELPTGVRAPVYGDFTGVSDFRSALEALQQAEEAFMTMPARVRARFLNDPANFVDFCSDPANLPEMRELGLAVSEATKPPASPPKAEGTQAEPGGQPKAS